MKVNKPLKKLHQATAISEEILHALKNGDSNQANSLAELRLSLIQSISFSDLLQSHPKEAPLAIEQFEKSNHRLIETSNNIKLAISDEIKKVKKSLSGAKIYNEINKQ